MANPTDTKFSNFADGGDLVLDDIVVGLRNGINTRFSFQGEPGIYLPLAGGTMAGVIDMDSNSITDLPEPTASSDAATKNYVDTSISTALGSYLPLAGGTMSGAIAMGTNKITGLGTPTVGTDAATKAYADLMLPLAGGTMSGDIAMGTFKITGMGNPTLAQDAATKFYVDAQVAAASPLTTKGDLWGYTTTNARLPVGSTNGQVLQVASGAAAGLAYSTAAYPLTATSTGSFIYADGTNFVQSTSLWPNTVGSAGKIVQSDGTTNGYSTPLWPTTGGTAGSVVISDGTNKINSTSLWPNTVGSAGKIIRSDGTTNAYSTSTFADTYLINTIPFAASANTIAGATLTSIIDTTIGSTQGNILYRNASAWVVLAPGTSGQFLQTQGAAANPQWAPGDGAGTVTSISQGTGITLTPNPITSSGSVALTIPVVVSSGGTGLTAVTAHYLPIGNGTSAITLLAPSATSGVPLISQGSSADPAYGTAVVAGGGTGLATLTAYGLMTAGTTATGAMQQVTIGNSGTILRSGGASALPSFSTATYPATAGTSGNVLTSDGTNWNSTAPAAAATSVIVNDDTTNATMYPTWVTANSGSLPLKVSSAKLFFNPSTSTLSVVGNLGQISQIVSASSEIVMNYVYTSSAVNYVGIGNNSTGNAPYVYSYGSDSTVQLALAPKGGMVNIHDFSATAAGELRFMSGSNTGYTGLTIATAQATQQTFTLPAAFPGSNNMPMTSTTAGVLSFSGTPFLSAATATSISFGGSVLNTYTEGTFTPVLVSSGGGTATYNIQQGSYTKIGNRVLFEANLNLTNHSLSAGNLTITGLPFSAGTYSSLAVTCGGMAAAATTMIQAYVVSGSSVINLYKFAAGVQSTLTVANISTTAQIFVSGHFYV